MRAHFLRTVIPSESLRTVIASKAWQSRWHDAIPIRQSRHCERIFENCHCEQSVAISLAFAVTFNPCVPEDHP